MMLCLRREADEEGGWKTKVVLPHVALGVVSAVYIIVGAVIFYTIEKPYEVNTKRSRAAEVQAAQKVFLEKLWDMDDEPGMNDEKWYETASQEFDGLIGNTMDAFSEAHISNEDIAKTSITDIGSEWNFATALFFSTVIITTIGYGNLVPRTYVGRIFCVAYALFGIPLALLTIADLGKFVGMAITKAYDKIKAMVHKTFGRLKRHAVPKRSPGELSNATTTKAIMQNQDAAMKDRRYSVASAGVSISEEPSGDPMFSVPASFFLMVLLSYTAVGAIGYLLTERWSFTDAFYFCFVTMSTIGFGDLVPSSEKSYFLLLTIFYIIVGLVLTTMTIDMVGIHWIHKIHSMGRTITDAREALAKLGDKAANMGDLLSQVKLIQKKYGLSDKEIEEIVMQHEKMFMVPPSKNGKPLLRAYKPENYDLLSFIDTTVDDWSTYGLGRPPTHRTIDCIPEVHELKHM